MNNTTKKGVCIFLTITVCMMFLLTACGSQENKDKISASFNDTGLGNLYTFDYRFSDEAKDLLSHLSIIGDISEDDLKNCYTEVIVNLVDTSLGDNDDYYYYGETNGDNNSDDLCQAEGFGIVFRKLERQTEKGGRPSFYFPYMISNFDDGHPEGYTLFLKDGDAYDSFSILEAHFYSNKLDGEYVEYKPYIKGNPEQRQSIEDLFSKTSFSYYTKMKENEKKVLLDFPLNPVSIYEEGCYKEGEPIGKWRYYHTDYDDNGNGELAADIDFALDGSCYGIWYYPNGKTEYVGAMNDNGFPTEWTVQYSEEGAVDYDGISLEKESKYKFEDYKDEIITNYLTKEYKQNILRIETLLNYEEMLYFVVLSDEEEYSLGYYRFDKSQGIVSDIYGYGNILYICNISEDALQPTIPEDEPELQHEIREVYPISMLASSALGSEYSEKNLCDNDYSTAWVEGREGSGTGESIRYTFDNNTVITSISIVPGYTKNEDIYIKNNRPVSVKVEYGSGSFFIDMHNYDFDFNHPKPYSYHFDFPLENNSDQYTLDVIINEVKKGTKYEDTCISEIKFYGYLRDESKDSILQKNVFEDNQDSETSEYVVDGSDSGYFGVEFFEKMSDEDLRLARNEILARHGRIFVSQDLNDYFRSKSWYHPLYSPEEFDPIMDQILNKWEKENIENIQKVEASRK